MFIFIEGLNEWLPKYIYYFICSPNLKVWKILKDDIYFKYYIYSIGKCINNKDEARSHLFLVLGHIVIRAECAVTNTNN